MWFIKPTITPKNVVCEYLVDRRLEPAFMTPTRLSKLNKKQRDIVLALAERLREFKHISDLTVKLPRLAYLQNIVNYLIDNNVVVEKIPDAILEKFCSAAVNLQKKFLNFGKLSDVIMANIGDMIPKTGNSSPKT